MQDTIFAPSSGAAPAAIAVIRISGPQAGEALRALAGRLPAPRRASYGALRDSGGQVLDHALLLWFPGPKTATGEDLVELHCHGGRAVIAAVEQALSQLPGLRKAEPGEFTRRAFTNGRIDLAEAEGLADLLSAETELQRQSAMASAGGALSALVDSWRQEVLSLSALVEAALDFADEDDVGGLPADIPVRLGDLRFTIAQWLDRPRAEALREGFRVVIAGPPNAGKSTLFNALVESEAAITAPIAGTTRDVLTHPVAIQGVPFRFFDTAGLRDETDDVVEAIGIERARAIVDQADLILWLGEEGQGPDADDRLWEIAAQIDRADHHAKSQPRHRVSAKSGEGVDDLRRDLVAHARAALPRPGEAALNQRQHAALAAVVSALHDAEARQDDPLLVGEGLRLARVSLDRLLGRTTTEDMLDTLFGRFCIGK
ncbi:tRNA uridine-5-carboxymethylaminomethyl(34) synthesis GTPase MnmE [Novosphingobium terrae]|uniref:tRNA uridine-5-carboxymethylaminomethyl(34) synthesis GTPase MnmE n=1 Tax=Novosphingobium terrae TaxID=2726189 RepID=UPI00197EC6AB|nr:tRNA uridine-5-carboxymethylaminomethyl(34) synthesis GTPase MnmE [Novosphingobium terrae]